MTKKILALRDFLPEHEERVKEIAPEYEIIHSFDEADNIEDIEIVYSWRGGKEGNEFLASPNNHVHWIQTASAGIDYLPLELLKEKEIKLTNSSGIHAYGITESVFGMILAHTRGVGESVRAQEKKEWIQNDLKLTRLHNRTMMIVGTGKIGVQTGKVAKAFGMKTIGINRSGREVEYMDQLYTQESLPGVIGKADIVVNILPMTDQTKNMFDFSLFSKMKSDSIFVNVGRGGTVDTDGLIEALDKNYVGFAALDVFHEEPLPADHPLWDREDVLITPHCSGNFEDYDQSLFPIFEENLIAYLEGKELPVNLIDYSLGY